MFGRIWLSRELEDDLDALCRLGGRFAGTPSELRARELLKERLALIAGRPARGHTFPYDGWVRGPSSVRLSEAGSQGLECTSLVQSPPTPPGGLEVEVLDLGRGTAEDFAAVRDEIAGRAVLVRHEFPFTTGHTHRRRKYVWAREAGAAAFLIANNIPSIGPVTGSSGQGEPSDNPALGLSYEAGEALARATGRVRPRITLEIESRREAWTVENPYVEIPGRADEWVTLCAHLDGHDLAESALDNGSGVVTVLEVARRLAPLVPGWRRGLRVMFFTVEEWGLVGSRVYADGLSRAEREKIAMVINLDTVVGHPKLYALTSGREDVERFVRAVAAENGVAITPIRPVLQNSDHWSFSQAGIPSFRLIAGYGDPSSLSRYLLTRADTRDKVDPGQLRVAAMTTALLVARACTEDAPPARYRPRQ